MLVLTGLVTVLRVVVTEVVIVLVVIVLPHHVAVADQSLHAVVTILPARTTDATAIGTMSVEMIETETMIAVIVIDPGLPRVTEK